MTRPRIDPTESLRNTRGSMGDGTLRGRVRIATPYDPRRLRRATSAISGGQPPVGETVALTGTVTIAGAGTAVLASLDTIQAQHGFGTVAAAGDVPDLPVTATYLAEVDVRWTDGHRDTSVPQVTLNGTAIGQVWPDDGGVWGRWVDQVAFHGTRGDTFDVKVTPSDGTQHDAVVTVRLTVVEPLRTVAAAQATAPATARTWRAGNNNLDDTGTLTDTINPGSDIAEGDLLVVCVFGSTWNAMAPTLDDIPGWTTLAKHSENLGTSFGSANGRGMCWMIAVRRADAADIADTSTYPLVMNRPGTPEITDFIEWRVSAVPFTDGTFDAAGVLTESGKNGTGSDTTYTAPTLSGGSYGLVIGLSGNSSGVGGETSSVSIDAPATEILTSGSNPDGEGSKLQGGVGHVAVGDAAQITASATGNENWGFIVGAVCVLPVEGAA